MSDELARRAHKLLTEALDIDDAAARRDHVTTACAGDKELTRRMDELLRAADASGVFLEQPALETSELPPTPLPTSIGGYRIERALGAGGMATVYEAEQIRPHRRVALKVMRLALTHTSAVERFRFETDVLARLQHPGIAQIYEVGAQDDGHGVSTPFFAMEFIPDALPITVFCDRRKDPIEKRLSLFLEVCDAVHHGHTLGVIHRDIKPGNVLVGSDGRPKVIDFGVAKSTDPQRTNLTFDSGTGRVIGTFNYMSPEQRDGGEIDTRSDVYALGILLYELLSGRLPHDLSGVALADAGRAVRENAIKRPGTLDPRLSGDLEIVMLKALELDRQRRYPTVNAFTDDLRRFLDSEPILARPASTLYQARMFARRRRPLVLGASAVLAALVVGIAATSYMAVVATTARRATEARQQELQRVVEFQSAQLAGIDVPAMGSALREDLIRQLPDPGVLPESVNFTSLALGTLEQSLLERTHAAILEQFADDPLLRARMLQTLAGTMNTLGLPENAEPVLREALRLRRESLGEQHTDTLTSRHSMGSLLGVLGRHDEAVEILRDVHEQRVRALGAEHPETLRTASTLGGALRYQGEFDEAARVWEDALAARRRVLGDDDPDTLGTLNNVGVIHALRGDLERAEHAWKELLERRARLVGEDHLLYQASLTNLGLLLHERGKLDEARDALARSLTSLRTNLGDEHPSTLSTMGSLGVLLCDLGEYAAGQALLRECLTGRIEILGSDHPRTLRTRAELATYLAAEGRSEEAIPELRSVLDAQERVAGEEHPLTLDLLQRLASVYLELGDTENSTIYAGRAVERARSAGLIEHASTAWFLTLYARALSASDEHERAVAAQREAHEILSAALTPSDPKALAAAAELADLYDAWNANEPDPARADEADRWRELSRDAGATPAP